MDDPFLRSRQSLAVDGPRGWLPLAAVTALLLSAWLVWFTRARVSIFALSDEARLEASLAPARIQAPAPGIVAARVELDQRVEAGQLLFEIDSRGERARISEQESQLDSAQRQSLALDEQVRRTRQVLEGEARAASASLAEARARVDEAAAAASFAGGEAARARELHQSGLLSSSELAAADTEAAQRRAAADRELQSQRRLESQLQAAADARQGELAELERRQAQLLGQSGGAGAALEGLRAEIARRTVLAPVSGRVAAIAELVTGAVVEEGDLLATIVPSGEVRVVAQFRPSEALGRVWAGQPCRVRLEGFSWPRYDVLRARVSRVASEPRSGLVRVEAVLEGEAPEAVPLQHGLPGVLEVEVERVSPATLVLRAAGRRIAPGRSASPPDPRGFEPSGG